jgi:hypothetical protein
MERGGPSPAPLRISGFHRVCTARVTQSNRSRTASSRASTTQYGPPSRPLLRAGTPSTPKGMSAWAPPDTNV